MMGAEFEPRLAPVARVMAGFSRSEIESFIAVAIELLDLSDADPELEPDGDELDGTGAEDDFCPQTQITLGYPGCPVSDPGEDDDRQHRGEWGVNQSEGATNAEALQRAKQIRELGLERSPTGGWRFPRT